MIPVLGVDLIGNPGAVPNEQLKHLVVSGRKQFTLTLASSTEEPYQVRSVQVQDDSCQAKAAVPRSRALTGTTHELALLIVEPRKQ